MAMKIEKHDGNMMETSWNISHLSQKMMEETPWKHQFELLQLPGRVGLHVTLQPRALRAFSERFLGENA